MENSGRLTKKKGIFMIPGAYPIEGGYNFTFEAPEESKVSLLFYKKRSAEPFIEFPFEEDDRIGKVRSIRILGRGIGRLEYNYLVDGEVVQDPETHAVFGREKFGSEIPEDPHHIRCGLLPAENYDWEGTHCPRIPMEDMVIYKLHVRGFTKTAGSRVRKKGTFAGLIEMIPYLKNLGINAVELMPVYEFPEIQRTSVNTSLVSKKKDNGRVNYWGYIPGFYYAPKRSYCASQRPEDEMRDLIKALHKEGMECILEFYFPGNVSPVAATRALEFWKLFYQADGFHVHGEGLSADVLLKDGFLSETKLFVPGYDFASLFNGKAPGFRYLASYNSGFQETMRRLLKSDEDMVEGAMHHVQYNSDFHGTVNYMTSQDGFTLNDLVSYNQRHNEENGQENHDGCSYNYSWNCGAEGPTRRTAIRRLREQQIRNAVLLELLSQGIPMIYAGDEFGNSQGGNNNAWCQDNQTGWLDWRSAGRSEKLTGFFRKALEYRASHPILHTGKKLKGTDYKALGFPDISFHGERAWYVNKDNSSRMFGVMYYNAYAVDRTEESKKRKYVPEDFIFIAYNFHWEEREFALPNLPKNIGWKKVIDTSEDFDSCFKPGSDFLHYTVSVSPRSIMVLEGREEKE
ncbi:MAG: Type II secretory pathway, pullulanase PulA and related glycosidase [Blautia sp.]|nr:Type II secretory pathway, pullulanase PulA and related glycosidase [Blautia sp.]